MGDSSPVWPGIVVALCIGILKLFLARRDRRIEDESIVTTNPDDDSRAVFDERMQNPGELPPEP